MVSPYFIVRAKDKSVLCADLVWRKFTELAASDSNEPSSSALGLEIHDAVRVAAWFSSEMFSAYSYPEKTFQKYLVREGIITSEIPVLSMPHGEFMKFVHDGVYPNCFLRIPRNKEERKLLRKQCERSHPKMSTINQYFTEPKSCESRITLDEKGGNAKPEYAEEGDETMYYIVRTDSHEVLTKSFDWIKVEDMIDNKRLVNQLFAVSSLEYAQSICKWIHGTHTVSPLGPKGFRKKFNFTPPSTTDTFMEGIKTHKYPACLMSNPVNATEANAFNVALLSGLEGMEGRMEAILKQKPTAKGTPTAKTGKEAATIKKQIPPPAVTAMPTDVTLTESERNLIDAIQNKYKEVNQESAADGTETGGATIGKDNSATQPGIDSDPAAQNDNRVSAFHFDAMPVAQSSELIGEMVDTALSFERIITEASILLSEKKQELAAVRRELVDLEHITEFYDLNAADGYRMNKARQTVLQRRRILKNEILTLELAINYFDGNITPAKIHSFVKSVLGMDSRVYSPRAMCVDEVKEIIRNPRTQEYILQNSTDVSAS